MKPGPLLLVPLLLVACAPGPSDADLAALRAENAGLRTQLAALDPAPPTEELATDLAIENRRLERLAGVTAKGELVETADARFRAAHDPTSGRTTVVGPRVPAESTATIDLTRYAVAVGFTHPGEELAAADRPIREFLLLLETAGNASARLAAADAAELVADGERFRLPLGSYEVLRERSARGPGGRSGRSAGAGARDERLLFTLDRAAARALARSAAAELRLPGLTLPLTREHAALARAALLRSE